MLIGKFTMPSKLRSIKRWTACGAVLNAVSVVLAILLIIFCVSFSDSLGDLVTAAAEGMEQTDRDSPGAGYILLAQIFAGGGSLLLYIGVLAAAVLGGIFGVISLGAMLLGISWNIRHRAEGLPIKPGRVNAVIRIILNGLLCGAFLFSLIDSPSFALACFLAYQLIILGTHIRCLVLIGALMKEEQE